MPYVAAGIGGSYYYPLTWLYVTDLSEDATSSGMIPFVIDTGTPVTIIPRTRLPPFAFRPTWNAIYSMRGFDGPATPGLRFPALLSMAPRRSQCQTLTFDPIEVFIPDEAGHTQVGLLGLDALREVISIFDERRARLRRQEEWFFVRGGP